MSPNFVSMSPNFIPILASSQMCFPRMLKNVEGIPSIDLSKKISRNHSNSIAISIFVRVLKNSLRTVNLVSRGWKGAI